MKKLFCLLLALYALHAVSAQGWEQMTTKDRWGDDSDIWYYQDQAGTDSKNEYACRFGFVVNDSGLIFSFISKVAGNFAIHPGYSFLGADEKVTIQFRKDGAIQTFFGETVKVRDSDTSAVAIVDVVAVSILRLLKGNGTWDVLVESSNWYVRTKVTGNLPLSFDEKDMLIISADGKTVTGVKSQYKNLESLVIPNGVTSIGEYAFSSCTKLKTVTLPDSVTEIGTGAFDSCRALREISLPKHLTKIGKYAFFDCRSLQMIKIPDSVTEIGTMTFRFCSALREISLPKRLTKIGEIAFDGCRSLQTIKIPDSVTEIGVGAFDNCPALKNLQSLVCSIQNGFVIHNNAINGVLDVDLESYIVPANIEAIDFEAVFYYCGNLKSITVPKTCKLTNVPQSVQVIRN